MEIRPNEVKEVKVIGKLYGDDVKAVITDGGFHVIFGKKEKNSKKADALAAGSHLALASYQVEKRYGQDFEPAIFKSEEKQTPIVEDKTEILPDLMKNSGIEMFVLSKFNNLDFVMVKHGIEIMKCETQIDNSNLVLKNQTVRNNIKPNKTLSEMFANVIENKMKELNIKTFTNEVKK